MRIIFWTQVEEQDKVVMHEVPEPLRRNNLGVSNQDVDPYPLMHVELL